MAKLADPETPKTAVVYMRTSSRGQRDRATIKMQGGVTAKLVKTHGLTMLPYGPNGDGVLQDDGISGRLLEGRQLAAFVADVRARTCRPDYLVVYSASRLSRVDTFSSDPELQIRSETDEALINSVLRSHHVRVIDPDGVHDDLRPMNLHSQKEIKDTRRRTMDGKARRLAEGKAALGGKAPYGYRQVLSDPDDRSSGWTWEPHPVDAPNLRKLYEWFVEGGYSHAARLATANKFPMAKSKRPGTWDPVTIQGLVRASGIYLGERTLMIDGTPYVIIYPAIIDADMIARLERKTKERAIKRRAAFLGTGFLLCACGAHLSQHQSSRYNYSRCQVRGCGSVREEVVAQALWVSVVGRVTAYTLARQGAPKTSEDHDAKAKDIADKIAKVVAAQETLADLVTDGMPKDVWRRKNDSLNVQRAQLQAELAKVKAEKENDAKRARHETDMRARAAAQLRAWKRTPPTLDEKRKVLADVLNGGRAIVRFKPALQIELPPWGGAEATDEQIAVTMDVLKADGPVDVEWLADVG